MIAAITGKMRKRIILDLSAALGLGTAGAFAYW
jgi:cytochrome c oxidase subunit 7